MYDKHSNDFNINFRLLTINPNPGGGGSGFATDVATISIYTVICFELLEKTLTCPETLIIKIWIRI